MTGMTRRELLRSLAGGAAMGSAMLGISAAAAGRAPASRPAGGQVRPTKGQVTWQDCEIGLLYSFDLAIAAGIYAPNNQVRKRLSPKQYNPTKLDTDQWMEAAKAAGAGYAVFTATHFNGFMQWQSDAYPYGLKQAAWRNGKGDVVGDFVESCRKYGIRPGIYLSTHRNAYWTVWGHWVDWGKGRGTAKQAAFNRIAEKMVKELCSRYGPLVELWFDAGVKTPREGGPDVLPIFEKYQPDSVFYSSLDRSDHRWIGNEAGRAGYPCWATMPGEPGKLSHNARQWRPLLAKGDPSGTVWSPAMADTPLRNHNWFWKPQQDKAVKSVKGLVACYYNSVGRNSNLLIGEVITSEGLVPQVDIQRLGEFGREIRRRFSKPIAEGRGEGGEIVLDLPEPAEINHVVIMEDIAQGERIRAYELEGLAAGGNWTKLCEGISVGHKRIQRFAPVAVAKVRLRVGESTAKPIVKSLAVFNVS
ncbi:MAG: alpha-L-fucosidase [Planctomycetes bacterium]|nr:alpha-L-fucosidase [Planctomycetota bacterium]